MATSIDLAVDTSALTAVLLGEYDAAELLETVHQAPRVGLCSANRTELLVVILTRLGETGVDRAKQFLALEKVRTVSLDEDLADLAVDAIAASARGGIRLGSTLATASLATASLTRWQSASGYPCCSRAMSFRRPTFEWRHYRWPDAAGTGGGLRPMSPAFACRPRSCILAPNRAATPSRPLNPKLTRRHP